ncbi:MAG: hydantoinase/oxoprolinase family protein [bacterium]|nr:hydantoinase/oxoprolinase family protein [bacterium]
MLLGLDVGGTHTDAVLVDKTGVVASHKAVTDHTDLLRSIITALEAVTTDIDKTAIEQVNLSTTLSTNAIVENKIEEVGVVVSSGPGIDPANYAIGDSFHLLNGSIDHRGTEILALSDKELAAAIKDFKKKKLKVFAVVTKFSTRNQDHENLLEDKLANLSDFITSGHRISGQLNFPRRIATSYYNSAVWRIYNEFADAAVDSIQKLGINAKINILKADGGTMPLSFSRTVPVESILSGPAASIMGIVALCNISEDSIILDIGGTTTDIAIFSSGSPLIEREGISLNSRPTLVRALETRSIGIGGDSLLKIKKNEGDNRLMVLVGPERKGPAMAEGGDAPALIDALNYKGVTDFGNTGISKKGIIGLAEKNGITPDDLADGAVEFALETIKEAAESLVRELNNKPVYTIHDMIDGKKIFPEKIYAMGGPAQGFADLLSKKFEMPVTVPENYQVANAIGACLARTTFDIELFADTGEGLCQVPSINMRKEVGTGYSLDEAKDDAKRCLVDYLKEHGAVIEETGVEITESSSFKMVDGFSASGKDIRVKCQVKPGVLFRV